MPNIDDSLELCHVLKSNESLLHVPTETEFANGYIPPAGKSRLLIVIDDAERLRDMPSTLPFLCELGDYTGKEISLVFVSRYAIAHFKFATCLTR